MSGPVATKSLVGASVGSLQIRNDRLTGRRGTVLGPKAAADPRGRMPCP